MVLSNFLQIELGTDENIIATFEINQMQLALYIKIQSKKILDQKIKKKNDQVRLFTDQIVSAAFHFLVALLFGRRAEKECDLPH